MARNRQKLRLHLNLMYVGGTHLIFNEFLNGTQSRVRKLNEDQFLIIIVALMLSG